MRPQVSIIDGIRRIIGERTNPNFDPNKCCVCGGSGGINQIENINPIKSYWRMCRACNGSGLIKNKEIKK